MPLIPFPIPRARSFYRLANVAPAQSAELWARNGDGFRSQVSEEQAYVESMLEQIRNGTTLSRTTVANMLRSVLVSTAEQAAIFFALNWLILACTQGVARRRMRRDPLLA